MTATTVIRTGARPRRALLPVVNLGFAGAALTISVIALTNASDPASPSVVTAPDPIQAPAEPATELAVSADVNRSVSGAGDCFARTLVVRC